MRTGIYLAVTAKRNIRSRASEMSRQLSSATIINVVDRLVRGTVLSGVRMVKTGIDFMKESKLTLDFDKKSLIIPDDQIGKVEKPKVEKPVKIDLSDTRLGNVHIENLQRLQNRTLRLIARAPRFLPRYILHEELRIEPIHTIIAELASDFHSSIPYHSNETINSQNHFRNLPPSTHRMPHNASSLIPCF
ncbi:hypothetical protein TNCV_293321 [Trichonephila clavipes]|nr:hypothetical protein TNCV_293321 [Trichonephila clavipes]